MTTPDHTHPTGQEVPETTSSQAPSAGDAEPLVSPRVDTDTDVDTETDVGTDPQMGDPRALADRAARADEPRASAHPRA
jgi:hypothetical protein